LALMAAADPIECISAELPALLGVDAVSLCAEHRGRGVHTVPRGAVGVLLAGRDVVFRDAPSDGAMLHAEAAALAQHDALVRVPAEKGPSLLAIASRDRAAIDPAQGAAALTFLGRAVATVIG